MRHARRQDGFRGAYFSGSTVGLPAEVELPTGSDVDVVVVTAQAEPPPKLYCLNRRPAHAGHVGHPILADCMGDHRSNPVYQPRD